MSSTLKGLPLPIDSLLEALRISLVENSNAVLVAEPGAGKSTRVPPFLAMTNMFQSPNHRVLVLQPRRVAVFGLAKRIAEEQGWRLGDTIGYQVRLEKNSNASTRVEFITEGILIRRLLHDPELKGVGCVILDEFHERNLFSDLAIAWLKEIQSAVRPDLKILVMSATLDSEKVQAYLKPCGSLKAPGRLFPLTEVYSRKPMAIATTALIVERVMETIGECLADPEDDGGDILVFLPGAKEIRRCVEAAESSSRLKGIRVHSLSGNQKWEEQKQVLEKGSARRIIFSTNIAETSLTIQGVTAVIDSGLQNVQRYNSRLGVSGLKLEKISRASAIQRGGRAGREAPGRVFHLWSKSDEISFASFLEPEIARVDLSETVLQLAEWGVKDPMKFDWFEDPPHVHLREAQARLRQLGCISSDTGDLTKLGRTALRWPMAVRWAVFLEHVLEFEKQKRISAEGATVGFWIAAIMQERNLLSDGFPGADYSSYKDDLSLRFEALARKIHIHPWWNSRTADQVLLAVKDLARVGGRDLRGAIPNHIQDADWSLLLQALLKSHSDRIVRRRATTQKGVMVGGRGVQVDSASVMTSGEFWIALSLREVEGSADLKSDVNVPVGLTDLENFGATIVTKSEVVWNQAGGRPQKATGRYLFDLLIHGPVIRELSAIEVAGALKQMVKDSPQAHIEASDGYPQWLLRLVLARRTFPELGWPDPESWPEDVLDAWIGEDLKNVEHLKSRSFGSVAEMFWSRDLSRKFHSEFPEALEVPSGSRIPLVYDDKKDPVLSVRLQELFGWSESPQIAGGRVKVTLELLGPNYRPLQMTGDLRSFWTGVYQEVRKQLRAKYPKHSWPDDPFSAPAVAKGRPRR